jgi:hypothetical protein
MADGVVAVWVDYGDVWVEWEGKRMKKLPLRLDLRNHSPTGFAWGYGGSGPSQLSLAILSDVVQPVPTILDRGEPRQATARAVLAALHRDGQLRTAQDRIDRPVEAILLGDHRHQPVLELAVAFQQRLDQRTNSPGTGQRRTRRSR